MNNDQWMKRMTELFFKGKEFVYNHHLAVPHRPLMPDPEKSVGAPDLAGNLIIQGDNLHALKALLPVYAGKVDCIFIDPPYNTGNKDWRYNDRVNAPMIRDWLDENPMGVEDGLRHDKWCAMMWPRLKLLHELLADTGSFWMTLDDNEAHRGKLLLDEIFGEENFVTNVVWNSTKSVTNTALVSEAHTHILIYAKSKEYYVKNRKLFRLPEMGEGFSNADNDPRGPWKADPFSVGGWRPNQQYEIINPNTGQSYRPKPNTSWKNEKAVFDKLLEDNRIVFGTSGHAGPQRKRFLSEAVERGKVISSLWIDVGATTNATNLLKGMFGGQSPFDTPKPVELLSRIISIGAQTNTLILDSFAGSGTTAHAVLKANQDDGGNRRFIMVEMEPDIADPVTAERVRRVINGYGPDDKRTDGLGGTFTYCTLGEPIDLARILSGETLPAYADLAPLLFHMATNETLKPAAMRPDDFYVGASLHEHVWMIYRPDIDWLKSDAAALTLSLANTIFQTDPAKPHLVFAPARFVGQKVLRDRKINVAFVPFPDALYRVVREG
jgi:adenine-specific DNA-methyltransferase